MLLCWCFSSLGVSGRCCIFPTPDFDMLLVLSAAAWLLSSATAGSLRYDQTQTGDTNIHLQIKNVEVVALLDDSAAGEYDYDYSDFTEKPPKPGAVSHYNSSTLLPVEASNFTTTSNSSLASTTTHPGNTPESEAGASTEEPLLSSTATATEDSSPSTTKKTRRCGAGFYRDTLGRCRRIRRPHLQIFRPLSGSKPQLYLKVIRSICRTASWVERSAHRMMVNLARARTTESAKAA